MTNPNLSIIAAYDLDYGIGKGGTIPWRHTADMERFKRLTLGSTVIMGRKTFESLPAGALKQRLNVVVTRNKRWQAEGTLVARSLEHACEMTDALARQFVIGGQSLYEEAAEVASYAYLTEVQGYHGCDRFFPRLDRDLWAVSRSVSPVLSEGGLSARFLDLVRKTEIVDMDAVYANAAMLPQLGVCNGLQH